MKRVVLIAGGARGIGHGAAAALAADGWAVAFCYLERVAAAEALRASIEADGGEALALRCDLSDPDECARLVDGVLAAFGRIDALVCTAGPYRRVPLRAETEAGWRGMFDHNLHPVFTLIRLVAPDMCKRRWGRIVTFAIAGAERLAARPALAAHYAAKVALLALTRAWAAELAADGITANTISPGYIDNGSTPTAELRAEVPRIPAGRLGSVGDCVAALRFLLADEAGYVNGANLTVSGGFGI